MVYSKSHIVEFALVGCYLNVLLQFSTLEYEIFDKIKNKFKIMYQQEFQRNVIPTCPHKKTILVMKIIL